MKRRCVGIKRMCVGIKRRCVGERGPPRPCAKVAQPSAVRSASPDLAMASCCEPADPAHQPVRPAELGVVERGCAEVIVGRPTAKTSTPDSRSVSSSSDGDEKR